ncbi:MAG: glycosyl transferase [Alphaproteobacteria bacterium]|nr:glycosyl transferase [Alphaproteobacteria bacterium]
MSGSVLFYVQHVLGIGHLRRALHLVNGMAQEGLAVTLITGGEPMPELVSAKARAVVQLPPLRATDASFRNLVGLDGQPADETLWSERREMLLAALAKTMPDTVLIEGYPFARRAFRRELEPLIAAARARRPRPEILCSLRDIIVPPREEKRAQEIVDSIRANFDAVLVHGDPRLIRLEESFPLASEIADRLVYTGYVAAPEPATRDTGNAGTGEVLVSAGGGAVGGALMRAALAARRHGCLAVANWRILTGPNLPAAEFAELAADVPQGVIIERYRSDFADMLRRCRVSVSQAGYNTVLDIIGARIPAVLVPFAEEHETEQTLRAERLAACGVIEMLPAAALSPERLAEAIERVAQRPPSVLELDTAGAHCTAIRIARMIANRTRSEPDPENYRSGG